MFTLFISENTQLLSLPWHFTASIWLLLGMSCSCSDLCSSQGPRAAQIHASREGKWPAESWGGELAALRSEGVFIWGGDRERRGFIPFFLGLDRTSKDQELLESSGGHRDALEHLSGELGTAGTPCVC